MRGRAFIPWGDEVECVFVSGTDRIRGTLCLPSTRDAGHARFVDDLPIDLSPSVLDAVPLTLLPEGGVPVPACLVDAFATAGMLKLPMVPFPVELVANHVVVGSSEPGLAYPAATVRTEALRRFLGSSEITIEQVVREGDARQERARAVVDEYTYVLTEVASVR